MNSLAKGRARPLSPRACVVIGIAGIALATSACTPGHGGGAPSADCNAFPTAPACINVTHPPADVTNSDTDTDVTSCTPDCAGKMCGPNGCGGFCGSCTAQGTTCVAGACVQGECGQGGVVATGQLEVGGGIDFDKATITVEHKMDIDAFEDGCLTSVVIELGKGFGCTLHVEAGTATAPGGGLRITKLTFAADSQCPGFPDESEGQYVDFSHMKVMSVVPDIDKVTDKNAPESCLTTNFVVHLEGVLADGGGKTLNVAPTTIRVSGEMKSTGSTTASCPCQASCGGKQCGTDGCGFTCGTCDENAECDGSGQCICVPQCKDGQECGDDGCGGHCGTCGEFETCSVDGECIACTPQCNGKQCGDNGCGGQCGTCEGHETCNAQNQCACDNATCGGVCCGATDVCQGGACCTPQCSGKECGADSCGGVCGNCDPGESCGAGGKCTCTPQCDGKQCGSNGCGGQCGSCTGGKSCNATGQCVDPNQCVGTGFTAAEEKATDNATFVEYDAQTSGATYNGLVVQIWQNSQGAYPIEAQSAYNITGPDWQTCALCVALVKGCTATSCDNAKYYMATEGVLTVLQFDPTAPGTFEAVITDAKLKEVTMNQGQSTPVAGGGTWCMPDQVFLGPVTVEAATP